ncbi:hypothetical protein [Nostoc sp. TCL26-01]|uniref:hypothetical protein n=1 Tax=Nostoc sp. TCL26-01 TaxID=2576904 RepID=UPI0015C18475|nr:hypothetical protein [Nostoc sp. TCL26-01]QLE55467.1 hypothetical protein FD725_08025 [Nostoc sp. TCL26-01]
MTITFVFTNLTQPALADTSTNPKQQLFNELSLSSDQIAKTKDDLKQQIDDLSKAKDLREGSACDKLDALWSVIYATREPADNLVPFGQEKAEVKAFIVGTPHRFWNNFASDSDIVPEDYMRLTHRHGAFVQARLVIEPEFQKAYTGLLKGSDCVLGRFSVGVSPGRLTNRFIPGFAAKFFVDGKQASQNLIVQNSVAGQGSNMNYYENPLSNKLKFSENKPEGIAAFSRFHNTIQEYLKENSGLAMVDARELSVEHLASAKLNGKKVTNPKFPRFIFLVAPEGRTFSTEIHDYRTDLLALNANIPADKDGRVQKGIRLFDVYVAEKFTDNPKVEAKRIGYFESKSQIVASDTADMRVFFQHSITPREAQDYPGEYPKSTYNDESFTALCSDFGAALADMQPNPQDPSGNTSVFFQNYLKRNCGKS